MQVALVGAGGFTGQFILAELAGRGHTVRAVVRRAGAAQDSERVSAVIADAYDTEALTKALRGVDSVVSAFNPGWNAPNLYDNYLAGARSIQQATKDAGVARLLVVGGAASLYGPDGRQLFEDMHPPAPYDEGVRAARDYHAEIQDEQDLDWVFLSPPMGYGPMGPTDRRGVYRVGQDTPVTDAEGHSSISGPDLAQAIVDEVEKPRFHRARFTIGY